MSSLEAKIKALLEGKKEDLLSEEELVESIVELDEDGQPIIEAKEEDDESEDDESEDDDKDDDSEDDDEDDDSKKKEVKEEVKKDADADGAAATAKIKAGLSKKLEAGGEIKAASTDEPNNKKNNVDKNMQEHIDALVTGEELSEDFKAKAATILEAAVADGVANEIVRLEEAFALQLDEAVDAVKEQLVEDIDGFLNVIVEKWLEENELALERGIKVDIVENFIDGMKNLFKEHYIEVPDEKVNVLDEQAEQIEALMTANSELVEVVERLSEDVKASKKTLAIESIGEDLTDTDFEKFAGLMENIDYSEDFETKAKTILESYFPKARVKAEEIIEAKDEESTVPAEMNKYVEALSGQLKF